MALELLYSRHTIREYEPLDIPEPQLRAIIEAALYSPTGCDLQGIDLRVVTNKQIIEDATMASYNSWSAQIQANFNKRKDEYGIKNVVTSDAPCLIFLEKNERADDTFVQIDAGIILMSIMVAARGFGLDTMCLGCLLWGNPRAVEKAAGIEEGKMVMAIAIGIPRRLPKFNNKEIKCKATFVK